MQLSLIPWFKFGVWVGVMGEGRWDGWADVKPNKCVNNSIQICKDGQTITWSHIYEFTSLWKAEKMKMLLHTKQDVTLVLLSVLSKQYVAFV